jgi:transcriptional regulator with XRE-family HTH domain
MPLPPTSTQAATPGDRLKAARLAARLTEAEVKARLSAPLSVRELADRLGVTASRVSHLEGGTRNPSARMLLRLAEALGCDPASLDETLASRKPKRRQ